MAKIKVLIEYNGGDGFYFAEGETVTVTPANEYILGQLVLRGQAIDPNTEEPKKKKEKVK